ncbi:MAG: pitrilysin family protein [Gemmatimonadota bacterium]|jgi:predicted Zn-dependent peptidase
MKEVPEGGGASGLGRAGEATALGPDVGPDGPIAQTFLDNGVRVLTERIPGVRSAAVGVWVRHGAAHEPPHRMGGSHLLEHMVFKGTERRTPRDIALALESLGGSLDAYTSREHTSFQARVLDEHLPDALDVLADITLSPTLRGEDLALEREVVLEEIATVQDTPDDLVFEIHAERLWRGHPYGHSILGTPETVASFPVEELRALHASRYRGRNLVVAAAGHVSHDDVVARAERLFGTVAEGERTAPVVEPEGTERGEQSVERPSAQTHVVFGTDAVPRADPRRYPLVLLSAAFGGGMSSRLFQRVREELALAYSVYSFHSFHARSGLLGVYVGTRPDWADQAVAAIREEYERLAREGLSTVELEQIKRQVKGQIMLSLETPGGRLYRLAGFALYDEPYQGLDQLLARIDAVSTDEAAMVAADFFDPERSFVLRLGPGVDSP